MDAILAHTNPSHLVTFRAHVGTTVNRRCDLRFCRTVGHQRVMCHHNASRMNDDDRNRARGTLGPIAAMACVLGLGALSLSKPMHSSAFHWRSATKVNVVSELEKVLAEDTQTKRFLNKLQSDLRDRKDRTKNAYQDLQNVGRELKRKKADTKKEGSVLVEYYALGKAVEMILPEYENAQSDPQDAFYLGSLLVELLIYQGNYSKAKEMCSRLIVKKGPRPSDSKMPLLELVSNMMVDVTNGEEKNWKDYYKQKLSSESSEIQLPSQPPKIN